MSIDLESANEYFDLRLWTDLWDNADEITRGQALNLAEMQVELLPAYEEMTEEQQERAVFEQALFLLRSGEEGQKRSDLQAQGVKRVSIDQSVTEDYDGVGITFCPFISSLLDKIDPGDSSAWDYKIGDLI